MKRVIITMLIALISVLGLVQPSQASVDRTPDKNGLALGCTYSYSLKAGRANIVHETSDGKDFWAHIYVQLAETSTPGCTDNMRNATNFVGNWHGSPANMGARGHVWMDHESLEPPARFGDVEYAVYSSGPDGTFTVYSAWTPRYSCHSYRALTGVSYVSMGGVEYRVGNLYASNDYPYCPV